MNKFFNKNFFYVTSHPGKIFKNNNFWNEIEYETLKLFNKTDMNMEFI